MPKDTSLRDYLLFLRLSGKTPGTIATRTSVLRGLVAFAGNRPLLRLTAADLMVWRSSLRVCPQSVICYVSHVRAFYAWAVDVERIRVSPAARIPAPRRVRRIPRPISEADMARALRAASPEIRLMLVLAGMLGLRCCEIGSLRWESVALHARVLVVTGKGGKERALPLSDWLLAEFHRYGAQRTGWVFPRQDGRPGPNTAHRVSQMINQFLRNLGIDSTAHKLRHRFATQLLDTPDGNLRVVQEALGHARLETVAIYTLVSAKSMSAAITALPVPDELPEAA